MLVEARQRHSKVQKLIKSHPGNYRPIGLTSVVGKLMEPIREKTSQYLETNGIINDSQHGFRNKVMPYKPAGML